MTQLINDQGFVADDFTATYAPLDATDGTDQNKKGRTGEMKVCQHCVEAANGVARLDEQIGLAIKRFNRIVGESSLQCSNDCCPDGNHTLAGVSHIVELAGGGFGELAPFSMHDVVV